jgi:hypothetical protein
MTPRRLRVDHGLGRQFAGAFTVLVVFLGVLWAVGLIRPL